MIRAAAILFSLIAEGAAAYALARFLTTPFGEGEQEVASLVIFGVVSTTGFLIPRFFDGFAMRPWRATALAVIATYVVVYGALRIEFAGDLALWDLGWVLEFLQDSSEISARGTAEALSAVALFTMWSRSWWRSRREIETDLMPRDAAIPFGVVTATLVAASTSQFAGDVAIGVLTFYAAALLALACSQLARSGKTMGTMKSGDVVVVLLASTVAATLLGVVVFGVLFGIAVELLEPFVTGPLAHSAEFILLVLLTPVAWVLGTIFDFLFGFLGDATVQEVEPPPPFVPAEGEEVVPEESEGSWSRIFGYLTRGLIVVVGVMVITFLVFLLVRLQRSRSRDRDAASESSAAGGLGGDLRDAWNRLFRRQSRPLRTETGAIRLYLDVLDSAEDDGVSRPISVTAAEFQGVLHEQFHTDATDEITQLFQQARYADREPDQRTVDALRERWKHPDEEEEQD